MKFVVKNDNTVMKNRCAYYARLEARKGVKNKPSTAEIGRGYRAFPAINHASSRVRSSYSPQSYTEKDDAVTEYTNKNVALR